MNREHPLRILWLSLRHQCLNALVMVGSILLCALLSLARLPGMELLGIGPNWLLIWVVVWSLKHGTVQATVAGLALGWIQDGLTATYPYHTLSLAVVGFLTARLRKPRYVQGNFIVLAFVAFAMAGIAETVTAIQYVVQGFRSPADIWPDYQRLALSSALLTSLWAPALAYPLYCWWNRGTRFS